MTVMDSGYRHLSDQVYNVEPSKAKSNGVPIIATGKRRNSNSTNVITDKVTKQKYLVLLTKDTNNDADVSNNNGMQAMAVAPISI